MKIVAIRNGRLGDMAMLLPALKYLRQIYRDAEIICITSIDGARLLKNVPELNITSVIFPRFFKYFWLAKYLKKTNSEVVYCFESNKKYQKPLPHDSRIMPPNDLNNIVHYTERCLKLIDNKIKAEAIKANSCINILPMKNVNKTLIGLHITYSGWQSWRKKNEHKHRMLPLDYLLQLYKFIKNANKNCEVIINLLPEEFKILQKKLQPLLAAGITIISPVPNFNNYLKYLKSLDLLITPNTGVMHLASLLHTPTIALFSGFDPKDCGPWMPESCHRVIMTPNEQLGLAGINPQVIFENISELMQWT